MITCGRHPPASTTARPLAGRGVFRAYLSAESLSEVLAAGEQNSQRLPSETRRNLPHKEKEVAELQPA